MVHGTEDKFLDKSWECEELLRSLQLRMVSSWQEGEFLSVALDWVELWKVR